MKAAVYYLVRSSSNLRTERFRVKQYLERRNLHQDAEYIENGDGTGRQVWPVLMRAVNRLGKSRLIIAKVGRLKWNTSFMRILQDSQVSFDCCDEPDLCETTVHIQAAIARNRAMHISQKRRDTKQRVVGFDSRIRTKDKRFKQGIKLGGKNSAKIRAIRAKAVYVLLLPKMKQARAQGQTYEQVAETLNKAGHLTTIGTPFNGPTVFRIMQRETRAT